MTDYWIDLPGCQSVINRVNDKLDAIRTDFDKTPDNLAAIRESICAAEESSHQEMPAQDVDRELEQLVSEDLPEHLDHLVSEIRRKVNALQDVVNYYAHGDAEMAHRAAGTSDQMPEFAYPDAGYVTGHPARGNTEHPEYIPGHPARGLAGNDGTGGSTNNLLTDDYATTTPFYEAEAYNS